jgi:hypothetical protein
MTIDLDNTPTKGKMRVAGTNGQFWHHGWFKYDGVAIWYKPKFREGYRALTDITQVLEFERADKDER